VSLAAIRRAATLPDVASVLAQDLALAVPMVLRPDFAEGVRAQLVDKDRTPAWDPARLEDVDPADVAALFTDL
jgi:enoyl-CoA hydratase